VDSIIFVGINFRKLKKKWQVVDTHFRDLWNSTRSSFIENAFKFCGKLIHFYKERISFLFYCEDGKRGAVS
jgi:hypothetical protein